MGVPNRETGDPDRARACYEAALSDFREIGSRIGVARVLFNLGNLHRFAEQYVEAITRYEQAEVAARDSGEKAMLCQIVYNLAACALEAGQVARASMYARQARDLSGQLEFDDYELASQVLEQRLLAATEPAAAIAALDHLRAASTEDWTLALVERALWSLTGDETHREAALAAYDRLFAANRRVEFSAMRDRLAALDAPVLGRT